MILSLIIILALLWFMYYMIIVIPFTYWIEDGENYSLFFGTKTFCKSLFMFHLKLSIVCSFLFIIIITFLEAFSNDENEDFIVRLFYNGDVRNSHMYKHFDKEFL